MAFLEFVNAAALGAVWPILYYMIRLPDSIWIALLIVVDSLGRLIGKRLLRWLEARWGLGSSVVISQSVYVGSFAVLICAGTVGNSYSAIFGVVYLSRFLGALAEARFASFQSVLLSRGGRRALGVSGFVCGCAISMLMATHEQVFTVAGSPTFFRAVECGGIISVLGFAAALAGRRGWRDVSIQPVNRGGIRGLVRVMVEAAFAMNYCVLPLMLWETFMFSPAAMCCFFCVAAVIVICVRWILFSRLPELAAHLGLAIAGLLLATAGFAGFMISWWIAFADRTAVGYARGLSVLCVSAVSALTGVAMLQVWLFDGTEGSVAKFWDVDDGSAVTRAAAAMVATLLWSPHERTSFAVPAVFSFAALGVVVSFRRQVKALISG